MDLDQFNEIYATFQFGDSDINDKSVICTDNEKVEANISIVKRDIFTCLNCGIQNNLILYEGNYICENCNMIYDRVINECQEWRYYGNDDNKSSDPSRCCIPVDAIYSNIANSSYIANFCSNPNKKNLNHNMRQLVKYQQWTSISYKDRNFYNTIELMANKALNSGLPKSIIDDAQYLYKEISETKLSRGENRIGLLASSIYVACRKNNVPRSPKEIAKIFNVDLNIVNKSCKKFSNLLHCNINSEITPYDFLPRFCSKLKFDEPLIELCHHFLDREEELVICSENSPNSVCAGAIFYIITILQLDINKTQVSDACEISEITINKCFKKFCEFNAQLLTENLIKMYNINIVKISKKIKTSKQKKQEKALIAAQEKAQLDAAK